jgi:hypothetical protein
VEELEFPHDLAEWRPFIDTSKPSWKAVLLYNGKVRSY